MHRHLLIAPLAILLAVAWGNAAHAVTEFNVQGDLSDVDSTDAATIRKCIASGMEVPKKYLEQSRYKGNWSGRRRFPR